MRERRRPVTDAGADTSIGLVHDYLLVLRGAERVFAVIAGRWADAPIYTALYSPRGTRGAFDGREVHTSYLQRLHVGQRGFRRLLPFYPRAIEHLDVSRHDLVISSSSAFAHGVRPRDGAVHVCYCHSPFRYAWQERVNALDEVRWPLRPFLSRALARIREWDRAAAQRVNRYIAPSSFVREQINRVYARDAAVVHPPVDVTRFSPAEPEDYFLVVSELVPHKRVDVALEAARLAGRKIKVVGHGPELERLRSRYGATAELLGRIPDHELDALYERALAVVVPSVEEFGIVAVEAQAAGRPVLSVGVGGATETVIDGRTGLLVDEGSVGEFSEAMRETDFVRFDVDGLQRQAARFSVDRFTSGFEAEVGRAVADI